MLKENIAGGLHLSAKDVDIPITFSQKDLKALVLCIREILGMSVFLNTLWNAKRDLEKPMDDVVIPADNEEFVFLMGLEKRIWEHIHGKPT